MSVPKANLGSAFASKDPSALGRRSGWKSFIIRMRDGAIRRIHPAGGAPGLVRHGEGLVPNVGGAYEGGTLGHGLDPASWTTSEITLLLCSSPSTEASR